MSPAPPEFEALGALRRRLEALAASVDRVHAVGAVWRLPGPIWERLKTICLEARTLAEVIEDLLDGAEREAARDWEAREALRDVTAAAAAWLRANPAAKTAPDLAIEAIRARFDALVAWLQELRDATAAARLRGHPVSAEERIEGVEEWRATLREAERVQAALEAAYGAALEAMAKSVASDAVRHDMAALALDAYEGTLSDGGPIVHRPELRGGGLLPLAPSLALRSHSPGGFAWGSDGSGPAQLALALLLDWTGDPDLAQRLYQRFLRVMVAAWPWEPGEEWCLPVMELDYWIKSAEAGES